MNSIDTLKDKIEKEARMVNERIYVAIAIALTGVVLATLMTVFNLPA